MRTQVLSLMSFLSFSLGVAALPASAKPPIPVKCSKTKIKSAMVAKDGEFEIQEGLAVDKRSGYVGRKKVAVKGCAFEANPGDVLLLNFSEKQKSALQRSTNFEMQCVDAEKPNGKFLGYGAAPHPRAADGKYWTPICTAKGLSKAEKKACAKDGSNSGRQSRFKEAQAKSKLYSLEVMVGDDASRYAMPDEPLLGGDNARTTAAEVAPSGKVFCQYYDKANKNVLFTLNFDLPKS